MKANRLFSCTFATLSLLAAGCGPVDAPSYAADEGEQSVSEIASGLGESGCNSVTPNAEISSNYCGDGSSTSPNTSYDHSTCPHQWVVEFTGSVAEIDGFGEGWGDTALTSASACGDARYEIGVYKYVSGAWVTPAQTARYHGAWDMMTSVCNWELDSGFSDPAIDLNATKYRLAVLAYSCNMGSCFPPPRKRPKLWYSARLARHRLSR